MPAGRFAPSPTSDLHLGNLRTALLAWLFARTADLAFILRIEDLDQARVAAAPKVADRQLADLEALGLDWHGPVVRQSERFDYYRQAAAQLETYECYCTRREISAASQAPNGAGYSPYPGTCAQLSPAVRAQLRAQRPAALRVRAHQQNFTAYDLAAGPVTAPIDDFVLFRNDGTPSYNLAVVVDDGLQNVVQVTRGADLLDCAPRQSWLATRLGFTPPQYCHVGMVYNRQGNRLAKRDGAVTLRDLRACGLTTSAVLRLLSRSCGFGDFETATALLAAARRREINLHNPAVWSSWVFDPKNPSYSVGCA